MHHVVRVVFVRFSVIRFGVVIVVVDLPFLSLLGRPLVLLRLRLWLRRAVSLRGAAAFEVRHVPRPQGSGGGVEVGCGRKNGKKGPGPRGAASGGGGGRLSSGDVHTGLKEIYMPAEHLEGRRPCGGSGSGSGSGGGGGGSGSGGSGGQSGTGSVGRAGGFGTSGGRG